MARYSPAAMREIRQLHKWLGEARTLAQVWRNRYVTTMEYDGDDIELPWEVDDGQQ